MIDKTMMQMSAMLKDNSIPSRAHNNRVIDTTTPRGMAQDERKWGPPPVGSLITVTGGSGPVWNCIVSRPVLQHWRRMRDEDGGRTIKGWIDGMDCQDRHLKTAAPYI